MLIGTFLLHSLLLLPVPSIMGVKSVIERELPWKFLVLLHEELGDNSLPLTSSGAGLGSMWQMDVEIWLMKLLILYPYNA